MAMKSRRVCLSLQVLVVLVVCVTACFSFSPSSGFKGVKLPRSFLLNGKFSTDSSSGNGDSGAPMLGHRHENGQSTRVSVSSASSSLEGSVSETPVDASLPQVPLQYTKKNHGSPIQQSYENQNMNTFRSATTPNMHDQLHRDHHHEQQQQQQQQQFSYPPSNAGGQVPPEQSHTVPSPPNANTLPTVSSTSSDIAGTGTSVYGTDLSQANKDLIFDGLKNIYKNKVLPLEMASKFSQFGSPPLSPSDFEAKPIVLVLGQYSVGKTSFIRSLLKRDFPGQRIGPEPTTDRFTAIMQSSPPSSLPSRSSPLSTGARSIAGQYQKGSDRLVPGHALVMQPEKGFQGLASFGNDFLSKFEGVEIDADILRNITIIDTPGVLSGEKQRIGRDYNYAEVVKWFAERADMIVVMFDAHKLDISDELRTVLDTLKPHHEKIRILLNKADSVDSQSLLRVYGALMWSLGKVVRIPEASRVYMGSFWDAPLKKEGRDNVQLLNREKSDLMSELNLLPRQAAVRRINELIKRSRSVKVHAYIIHYLRKQMPYLLGRSDVQRQLIGRLDKEFLACARRYNLPWGDFPSVDKYRAMLSEVKQFLSEFKRLDKNMIREMDKVMTVDIPKLLEAATAQTSSSQNGISRPDSNGK